MGRLVLVVSDGQRHGRMVKRSDMLGQRLRKGVNRAKAGSNQVTSELSNH